MLTLASLAPLARSVLIGLGAAGCSALLAQTPVRHSMLFQGKKSGSQTVVVADGVTTIDFTFRNNGRGPDLNERLKLAPDGTPVSYQASGKSMFGSAIDEVFSRQGDAIEWRSTSDRGRQSLQGSAFYVPVEFSPELMATLIRALNRQPGQRLPSLPGGELRVERVIENLTLTDGARTTAVTLYGVIGMYTQPAFVWLTADAEQRLFAMIYPGWSQMILAGWEVQADALEQRQVQAEGEWLKDIARRLTHALPEPIVFRNVRVFDPAQRRLGPPSDVYVRRGRIAAVYEASSLARSPGTEIAGEGRVLLPGLYDLHSHESPWNSLLQIAAGVTTVRDMSNDNAVLAQLITSIESGALIGPRIIPAGFIEGESPHSARGGIVVKDLAGAKEAVDWYAQRGFRQIKIYNSFKPEWVEPVAAYAHHRGLRVSGHIPAFMRAEEAVRAGFDEIQHINQVMLNFLVKPEDDTRTLLRFYLIGDHAHEVDLDSERVTTFIQLLKSRGTVIDPTLACFEGMFLQRQGEMNPSFQPIAKHVPVVQARNWRTNSMDVTDENADRFKAGYLKLVDFVGRMHRAGIPIVAGTDDIAGFTLHREFELYVKAGIAPTDVLRIATWNGATYTGTLGENGTIEPGKHADLVLIDGDPTTDISALRRAALVMKGGTAYYPAELYEAMGVKRFVSPPDVHSTK